MKAPTQKQLIERWENVLRVLRALTPHQRKKHWDMSKWGYQNDCGTIHCAAGACGLDPWFRRRGFKLEPTNLNAYDWSRDEFVLLGKEMELSTEPEGFFGHAGVSSIFRDSTRRPVSQVIKEVRAHIKTLKSA